MAKLQENNSVVMIVKNGMCLFPNLSAAYSELSSSIPTIDMEIDPQRRAVDESDVQPTPPPPSLNPVTPITHPRQTAQDMDPFVSPVVKVL